MQIIAREELSLTLGFVALLLVGCGAPTANNTANNANSNSANSNASPTTQQLTVVDRPDKLKELMASRGEQENAKPVLRIVEPRANSTLTTSTVKVKLSISGDLKGYKLMMEEATHTGNHIHVILDNEPYEAYYNLDREFELRNVADGEHTLRVFPSRPWHESYKNQGAFQMVRFAVSGGGADSSRPTTTNTGNLIANSVANANVTTKPTPEGKDMQSSKAGPVDPTQPLLTYSRPKGEYKSTDANEIMIDFWLTNASLVGDGGQYRVRYTLDGREPKYIDKWEPIWLSGWTAGKHTVKLELVTRDGQSVDNGGYNSTSREITVVR